MSHSVLFPHPLSDTAEKLWASKGYAKRISALAGWVHEKRASPAEIAEYRAHLVLFRMLDSIGEEVFNRAMAMSDVAEARVKQRSAPYNLRVWRRSPA